MPFRSARFYLTFSLGVASVLAAAALANPAPAEAPAMEIIYQFEEGAAAWPAQNDGVMGGVSSGASAVRSGLLHFFGEISLENNGGFAQVYAPIPEADFSGHEGVRLRVKGDGRTYQFRLTTDARYRGARIAYRAEFPTEAGAWEEVFLPFEAFRPSFRGRLLDGPPLDPGSVQRVAFLLADGQPGAFSLKVDWIGLAGKE